MIAEVITGSSVGIVCLVIFGLLLRAFVVRCMKKKRLKAERRAASQAGTSPSAEANPVVTIPSSTPRTPNVPPPGWAVSSPTHSVNMDWAASTEMLEMTAKEKLKSSIQQVELTLKLAEGELNPQVKHALLDAAKNNLIKAQNTSLDIKVLHCSKARMASRSVDVLSERPGEVRIPMNDLAGGVPLMAAANALSHPVPNMNNHQEIPQVHQRQVNKSVADLASYPNGHIPQNLPTQFVPPNSMNPFLQPGFRPEFLQMMHPNGIQHLNQGLPPMMPPQYFPTLHHPLQDAPLQQGAPIQEGEVKKNFKIDDTQETHINSQAEQSRREEASQRLFSNPPHPQIAHEEIAVQAPSSIPVTVTRCQSTTDTPILPATSQTPPQSSLMNNPQHLIFSKSKELSENEKSSPKGDLSGTNSRNVVMIPENTNKQKENNEEKNPLLKSENKGNDDCPVQKNVANETRRLPPTDSEVSSEDSDSDESEDSDNSDSGDSYQLPTEEDEEEYIAEEDDKGGEEKREEKRSSSISEASVATSRSSEDDSTSSKDTSTERPFTDMKETRQRSEREALASQIKIIEGDILVTLKRKLLSLGEEGVNHSITSDENHGPHSPGDQNRVKVLNSSKSSNLSSVHKRHSKISHKKICDKSSRKSTHSRSTDESTSSEDERAEIVSTLRLQPENQPSLLPSQDSHESIVDRKDTGGKTERLCSQTIEKSNLLTKADVVNVRGFSAIESQANSPRLMLSSLSHFDPSTLDSQELIKQSKINENQTPAPTSRSSQLLHSISNCTRVSQLTSATDNLTETNILSYDKLKGNAVAFLPVPEIVRSHMKEIGVDESMYCLPLSEDAKSRLGKP